MRPAEEQFRRVERALKKILDNRNRTIEEYEDDVWGFFQNCWHLKDWVINDSTIPESDREAIVLIAHSTTELLMCADLANRSKHLSLRPGSIKGGDADISSRNLYIQAGTVHIHADGTQESAGGYGELEFIISDNEGNQYPAIDIARHAVDKWRQLLNSYDLDV